jgi:hypothetical protein
MPTMTKALLGRGFDYAIDCFAAGIDATGLTTWLNTQAAALSTPIAGTTAAPNSATDTGNFDNAVLAAVQSSPAIGVSMDDLRPILAQYNKPANQIGAALGRLMRKNLIAKNGNLWRTKVDKSIDTRRSRKRGPTNARTATAAANGGANAGEAQPQAATG